MGNALGSPNKDGAGEATQVMGESGMRPRGMGSSSDTRPEMASPSPVTGRSPLPYAPQVPTMPILPGQINKDWHGTGVTLPRGGHGWGNTSAIPTVITWLHGGEQVYIEGSFDNWSTRTPMHKHGKGFAVIKLLPPGVYQYKFIVDGSWRYAPDLAMSYDEMGNINNIIEVQDYVPENTQSVVEFEAPPSPISSYVCQGIGEPDEHT